MTEGQNNFPQIPKGWVWTTLEAVLLTLESGKRPKGGVRHIKTGIPSIGGEHLLYNGGFDFTKIRYVPTEFYENMSTGKILKKDVLVVKDGATTGKTAFVSDAFPFSKAAVNEHVFIMRVFKEYTEPEYLFFWMQSPFGQECVKDNFKGTAQGGINSLFIRNSKFPFPPFPEQHRIVSKCEDLFTRLDAGVESLNKTKIKLKRYRNSVLKDAFEGKLTEEWRKTHKHEIETASVLLERTREERKEKGKYKELPPVDTIDASKLQKLPECWVWTRIGEISEIIQYGTSERAGKDPSGVPVLRMGNIQDGKLVYENLKYYPKGWSAIDDFVLEEGDVLFNRTNSPELVGKTAVYKKHHLYLGAVVFASYLIRVRTIKEAYIPDILSFFINSLFGRRYIASVVSQQVGQANVNGTKLSLMPIPLIPFREQIVMLREIERCFSVADEMEKVVKRSLNQSEQLRQSILKKAFEGGLVPQDPTDEPAEKLLERIREKKEKRNIEEKRKRGKKNSKRKGRPKQAGLINYVK